MAKRKPSPPPEDEAPPEEGSDLEPTFELRTTSREFMQFLEAKGYEAAYIDPTTPLGLELQREYINSVGEEPLAILKSISENLYCKPSDSINAAKILLEYSRRKIPSSLELAGPDGGAIKIDRAQFAKLSTKELMTLEALLTKAMGQ